MTLFVRGTLVAAVLVALTATITAQPNVDARPNARKDPRDTLSRSAYDDRVDVVSLGIEYVASAGGGTFFSEYEKLGGLRNQIGTYAAPTIAGRIAIGDAIRLIVNVSFHSARFADSYNVRLDTSLTVPPIAGMSEDFSVFAIPIIGGIEYAPIRTQFTSYAGIGAGLAVSKAKWTSSLQYSNGAYTRPQRNVDDVGLAPALRAYVGVDLRFDRPSESRATFRGIFLEASYLFLPVSRDYFAELRSRGTSGSSGPETDDATLYLGGLSFTFGLNLQVLRK